MCIVCISNNLRGSVTIIIAVADANILNFVDSNYNLFSNVLRCDGVVVLYNGYKYDDKSLVESNILVYYCLYSITMRSLLMWEYIIVVCL